MAKDFLPLSLYPDFRLAMLNWLRVTGEQLEIVVPAIHKGGPPRRMKISMDVAISGAGRQPILAFKCGDFEMPYESGSLGVEQMGDLAPSSQVAVTCVGNALNRFIAAAYEWEKEQKANGHEVDALEDLGEVMVGVVNKMASMFNLQDEHIGRFSPPCWSPRWDFYITRAKTLGAVPSAIELFTGAVYEYFREALANLRRGVAPNRGFSSLFERLRNEFVEEARQDRAEARAVQEDEQAQRTDYFNALRRVAAKKYELKASKDSSLRRRPQYPTREERELKVMLPDVVQIADFSQEGRRRRRSEEDL
jgi:hypothetical protein